MTNDEKYNISKKININILHDLQRSGLDIKYCKYIFVKQEERDDPSKSIQPQFDIIDLKLIQN